MFTPQLLLFGLAGLIAIWILPALVCPKYWRKELHNLFKKPENIRIIGVLRLLIGFLILSVHWEFTGGWLMTISIIGWIVVIKGIMDIWFPGYVTKKIEKQILKSEKYIAVLGFLGVLFAVALLYIAFNLINSYEFIGV